MENYCKINFPLISTIIPTYKNRGGLENAVLSVLRQTYTNIEIVVVDDNDETSVERIQTEELMKGFRNNSKVVYLKHKKNKNGAAARNTGIINCKGSIVCFLDDDDEFMEEKLKKQYDFLKDSEYNAVYCRAFNRGGQQGECLSGSLAKELLLLKTKIYTPTLMFPKEVLIKIGCFDETYERHQDYELLLKFFKAGFTIGCVNENLVKIGFNKGENTLNGQKLEMLKNKFFFDFEDIISQFHIQDKRFKSKLYAIHFSVVFYSYLSHGNKREAFRIFKRYLILSPITFFNSFFSRLIIFLALKYKRLNHE